jgi:predicted acylesterase/phospholipase RssA
MTRSLDAYIQHVHACASFTGILPPETVDELMWLDAGGYLDDAPWLRPCDEVLRIMGLPLWIGRPVEPLDDHELERLLAKLVSDDDAKRALSAVLQGGDDQ